MFVPEQTQYLAFHSNFLNFILYPFSKTKRSHVLLAGRVATLSSTSLSYVNNLFSFSHYNGIILDPLQETKYVDIIQLLGNVNKHQIP